MIKQKKTIRHHKFENFEKRKISHPAWKNQKQFFNILFLSKFFLKRSKSFICASIALIKIPWEGPGSIPS
jgi:hypothetical protein